MRCGVDELLVMFLANGECVRVQASLQLKVHLF